MAGGYISCGDFSGDDKSGSAIFGVFSTLPEFVPECERDVLIREVLDPLAEYLDENEDHLLIESSAALKLLEPVNAMYQKYGYDLGHPEPFNGPQIDVDRGMKTRDAKWGDGIGWRYYCLHDLRIALRKSIDSGKPVMISFD